MKEEKQERLFRAIGDVGADLVDMAEKQTFAPSRWRKWGSLAACLAVILCLGVLALPYFPSGCGSSSANESSASPSAAVTEDAATTNSTAEVAESEQATVTEADTAADAAVRTRFVFRYTYYYLTDREPSPLDTPPSVLGELLGEVEACEDETLVGCPVYRYLNTTEYDNHSVNGLTVPQEIWVETEDGFRYAITLNEKTVARYTVDDVMEHLEADDSDWIVNTFVGALWEMDDFSEPSELTGEQLNRFLWYTCDMNTGVSPLTLWREDDGAYIIPADEAAWRLSRVLDPVAYDPTETAAYDADRNALVYVYETLPLSDALVFLRLELLEMIDENTLLLYVSEYGTDADLDSEAARLTTREFMIRFDEDAWRYLSITTQ